MCLKNFADTRRLVKCLVSMLCCNFDDLTTEERSDIQILIIELVELIE